MNATPKYPTRKSGAELPNVAEVLDILTKESQRKSVNFDYLAKHDALFEAHRTLSRLAGVSDDWIRNYQTISFDELAIMIVDAHNAIAKFIRTNQEYILTYEDLFNQLVPQQNESSSEAIFVFGAASNARIERAIELYQQGVAPKLILSGCGPHYQKNHETEAVRMANIARKAGVPDAVLVLEEKSVTLPDNVKRTLDMFETMKWQPRSITVVATNFVLRRATMEWYKFASWPIEVLPVAAHPLSNKFTEHGWYLHDDSIAVVLNEYAKLVFENKIDQLREQPDFNV